MHCNSSTQVVWDSGVQFPWITQLASLTLPCRSVPISIAVIWLTSALISFLPISLDWHTAGGGDDGGEDAGSSGLSAFNESAAAKHVCALDFSPTYSVISSLISFFIPCVIMVGIYFHVYSFARYHMYRIKEHNKPLLRLRKMSSMTAGAGATAATAATTPVTRSVSTPARRYEVCLSMH